jgi:hypothetical protein
MSGFIQGADRNQGYLLLNAAPKYMSGTPPITNSTIKK